MRRVLVSAALTVVAAAAVWSALGLGGGSAEPGGPSHPATTAPVKRETLVQYVTMDGEIGFGAVQPLASKAAGTVTWLASPGSTIRRGQPLLRVDDRPVVLLYGVLPAYRDLTDGAEGSDVVQLETNLKALGYTGFTVDRMFSASTAAAVRHWQEDLGLPVTGTVEASRVVYAAGAQRVSELLVRPGAASPADVLKVTGTTKMVTAAVPVADAGWAKVGVPVTVTPADGAELPGTVRAVAEPSPDGDSGGAAPKVTLTIAVADQKTLTADRGSVTVRYTAQRKDNVLTVPVAALLALAEGGYGVETGDGHIIAVQPGLFTDGRVEVSGAGLSESLIVRVPQ
jgi:peptidoglycan hydrolase-like protein with peptidoglycan-binding domain